MTFITDVLIAQTHRHGGATVSMDTGHDAGHTTGFYVGGLVPEIILPLPLDPSDVSEAVVTIGSATHWTGYIGTWTNGDRVHFDASEWYATLDEAVTVARTRGELAIWEIAGGTEFRL